MAESIQLELGLDVIRSYRRLSYKPWHAIAEFIDNSTQSYFDNRDAVDESLTHSGAGFEVSVVYDADSGLIRVSDNAYGMDQEALTNAVHIGAIPENTAGRSEYGMGMKTAACWLGNEWTVRTKKLGEGVEHRIEFNVERIAAGDKDLRYVRQDGKHPDLHYTVLEIRDLNRKFTVRARRTIRDFLASMYRVDLTDGIMRLLWNNEELEWAGYDAELLQTRDGQPYKKSFNFEVGDKLVDGWIGILDSGGRSKAGFSILRRGRVIKGHPDAWRPATIFGQFQGSNDLINQRIVGEVNLDLFEVSHTKDDILFQADEETTVLDELAELAADYMAIARDRRKLDPSDGPAPAEIDAAIDQFRQELSSPQLADSVNLVEVPSPEDVIESVQPILDTVELRTATFEATIGTLEIAGYLADDLSVNDPYVVIDVPDPQKLIVLINMAHPHITQLGGGPEFLDYVRHCTYDGLAEWKASQATAPLDPRAIKLIKDRYLRVPFQLRFEQLVESEGQAPTA